MHLNLLNVSKFILNLVKIPIEAKNVPIDDKRKRGRPTKAKRALEFQDSEKVIDDESNEDEVDIIQEPPTKRIACNQIDKTSSTIQVEPSTSGNAQESSVTQSIMKKRPGRPKGSKNKK